MRDLVDVLIGLRVGVTIAARQNARPIGKLSGTFLDTFCEGVRLRRTMTHAGLGSLIEFGLGCFTR
jgi:hypothetical protein